MRWNWQQPDWPNFRWDASQLAAVEQRFLIEAGIIVGAVRHLEAAEERQLFIEIMRREALTTSEIEGEILDRASVQSSIQRELGLKTDKRRSAPAEEGIAKTIVDLYRTVHDPLSAEMLFKWHSAIVSGRSDLRDVGGYRTKKDPMQVASGRIGSPKIHFEAPPAGRIPIEMRKFILWFNRTGPGAAEQLPAVTRAGIAHIYFESIHPFEDGNGRVGRCISEKALAQSVMKPAFTGLSAEILARRKSYYSALERANKTNELSNWLAWFAATALNAQRRTLALVEFLIAKADLLDRIRGSLNDRQQKALLRILKTGPDGFEGGLSAGNYRSITGASPATATRDLAAMVDLDILVRSGDLKHTRYAVNLRSLR